MVTERLIRGLEMADMVLRPYYLDPPGASISRDAGPDQVSVYSEFLRMALADEVQESGVGDLVSRAVTLRQSLELHGDAATRLARNLAYDVVLVRLCEAAGIEHHMTDDIPETIARQEAEARLAERLPAMRSILLTNQKGPLR